MIQREIASNPAEKRILICQNRTCRKQGAAKVLAVFERLLHQRQSSQPLSKTTCSETISSEDYSIQATGCLGKCGSGPMVVILPDETFWDHVSPESVASIIQQINQD
ncbi:MAG: (2Fe-2S) ferredoxin domain-containing protein [Microcoleaceae cyanobacterium]